MDTETRNSITTRRRNSSKRTTLRNVLKNRVTPSKNTTNSIHKRVLKLLVCGCGYDQMGTLTIPDIVPPPSQDAQRLKKAFQGWGTDEKAIIRVLCHRNASQRKEIREAYQQLCNQSLIDGLTSELSGDFGVIHFSLFKIFWSARDVIDPNSIMKIVVPERAVILWTYDPAERDAGLANKALKTRRKGVKEYQVFVEIACASSSNHLAAVRQAYCSLFDCSLEEEIVANVPLPLRKLLVRLVSSYRYDNQVVDIVLAESEAAKLHDLIEKKQFDHDELELIISIRSFFQLRATFDCYQDNFGKPIEDDIASSGNSDIQALLKIAILCIASPEKHFAEVIRASIVGLGTDEDSLTRAIVTRAEVDMAKIKEVYLELNKVSVEDAVIGDTSGDYKNFLLTLLGQKFD
ncbi:hypothetical protein V2J09_012087 [Rumex salicifolius]